MRLGIVLFILAFGAMTGASSRVEASDAKPCQNPEPEPFARGQPFLLNDPRSGLSLRLESDGRHMKAITRGGKILWQRNLFDDPKLERMFPPPPQIEGEPSISNAEWRRRMHSYVGHLGIDRIGIEPDCARNLNDHHLPALYRGHYIYAGSGTHIFWLLDAKTGDLRIDHIN